MDANMYAGGGDFLKGAELNGATVTATIESVDVMTFNNDGKDDSKLVLKLVGKDKRVVLNKTNTRNIIEGLDGNAETSTWAGVSVEIAPNQTSMGLGLRVDVCKDKPFSDAIPGFT